MAPVDEGSSGEDFNMREVDVMKYSDEEMNDELGNIAESRACYTTPDISPDILALWKIFTAKLPLECMTWLKEQLQTQFEVFWGWAGLTGLILADAPLATSGYHFLSYNLGLSLQAHIYNASVFVIGISIH